MGQNKASNRYLTDEKLDQLVLSEYPYPIAVNYKRLLEEQDWEKKTRACIQVFEFGLRAITLGLISQYLIRDVEKVSDPQLNRLLLTRLSRATLGTWNDIFFKALQAYEGKHNLFFMPELYDLYWDTSTSPHRPHKGLRAPFDRLVQIRNDLAHGVPPIDEATWQALFEESFRLLHQVLGHFTFLENYDLIRVLRAEGEAYWYDIYTGLQVVSPNQPLRTKEDLTEGWFYLSKQEKRFLELHPLFIFWEKELAQAERELTRDAAIFDRFRRTSVDYLATVLGERINLTDRTLLAEFIQMVYYNIEKVKMARREARKLTWWLLKEVSGKVSSERIGDLRSKYRREVYLQREETKESFEEFLRSDKTCLVLIGKSGVGKSNFFLWLMDEYEDSSEVCTLMYNGARFSAETAVAEALTRDFELYLKLEGLADEKGIRDILFEINRIEGIADRKVVLLIDALNENPDAKGLLRRVDALVEASPYPWLKVVISSRPETWRTIKRGVRLAEHKYYREEATEELGVEMQPFSIEVEMKPFGREELPAAYAKYQEVYGLQTDYGEIPVEVRQMLRDPLTLWLVAEIHRRGEIPQDIKASELYQRYVDVLIDTQRLYREDIRFLERELVPLMIREEEYANSITGETISEAETTDGKSLFELIHSDELLSSGRRVNQSYANLADAEILMELETDVDYEIVFKYERFYDRYVGKRIFELFNTKPDRYEAYCRLMSQIREQPFLWGVAQTALLKELQAGNHELVIALAQVDELDIDEILVAALSEFGTENQDAIESILAQMMDVGKQKRGWLAKVGNAVFRRRKPDLSPSIRMARRVAVETAYLTETNGTLIDAARDDSSLIRSIATDYIARIWLNDPVKGLGVLETLSSHVKPGGVLPDIDVLESCLGVSIRILLSNPHEESLVVEHLRPVWQNILANVLWIEPTERRAGFDLKHMLREALIWPILRIFFVWLERFGHEDYFFSVSEVSVFFQRGKTPQAVRERFHCLIPYIDHDYGDIDDIQEDLTQIVVSQDLMSLWLLTLIILSRSAKNPPKMASVVRNLYRSGLDHSPVTGATPWILLAFGWALAQQEVIDADLYQMHTELVGLFYDRHRSRFEPRFAKKPDVHTNLDTHIYFNYRLTGQCHSDFLERYWSTALTEKDFPAILAYIGGSLLASRRWGVPLHRAFELLDPVFELRSSTGDFYEKVNEKLVWSLSMLRVAYESEVDDLLEQRELDQSFIRSVRTNPVETSWMLPSEGTGFIFNNIVLQPKSFLFRQLQWLLGLATQCRSLSAWVLILAKGAVNMVYGHEVFAIGQPDLGVVQE